MAEYRLTVQHSDSAVDPLDFLSNSLPNLLERAKHCIEVGHDPIKIERNGQLLMDQATIRRAIGGPPAEA